MRQTSMCEAFLCTRLPDVHLGSKEGVPGPSSPAKQVGVLLMSTALCSAFGGRSRIAIAVLLIERRRNMVC